MTACWKTLCAAFAVVTNGLSILLICGVLASTCLTVEAHGSTFSGEILVLEVEPARLAKVLENKDGININEVLWVLKTGNINQIPASPKKGTILSVVRGPFTVGTKIRVTFSAVVEDGRRASREFIFEVSETTNTNRLLIINEYTALNPAKIVLRTFVEGDIVSERKISSVR